MKKVMLLMAGLFIVTGYSTSVPADPLTDRGREVINLKMGGKELPFQHWKHQTNEHIECLNCHKTKIGTIDGWGKEFAHKTCIPCHDLENKGPVQCNECHPTR